jgi:excinuclease ABC subunit C
MISQISDIKIHETDSVLEALILESNLIKKHQPKYNIEGKDDKSFAYVIITHAPKQSLARGETKEKFPRVLIARETDLQKFQISNFKFQIKSKIQISKIPNTRYKIPYTKTYGPYTSKKQLEIALKLIRKIFPYHSAKQASRNCCFEHQIDLCPGPYAGAISKKDYLKNIHGIEMILEGKKKKLLTELEKQMKKYSREQDFEKAAEARSRIFALKHIRDVALISSGIMLDARYQIPNTRIEAYDISNISGDFATGSMVVFVGNKPDKSQYRKFKILTVKGVDDVGMMREILVRRFTRYQNYLNNIKSTNTSKKSNGRLLKKKYEKYFGTGFQNNWPLPDLIFVDGGKGHLNMAQNVVAEFGYSIPVVAVAKGPTRKKLDVYYNKEALVFQNIVSDKKLVEKIRNEAHRFAIGYHKKLRRKNWKGK